MRQYDFVALLEYLKPVKKAARHQVNTILSLFYQPQLHLADAVITAAAA